jgi:hypothetical protein
MESINPIKTIVDSLLSGVPAQSLSDARKILGYLRTQVGTRVTCNLNEMRDNDIGWHTLFSADIYLFTQEKKERCATSSKSRWAYYNATRTKTSL